jgi:hypothetical protein
MYDLPSSPTGFFLSLGRSGVASLLSAVYTGNTSRAERFSYCRQGFVLR